ncbi:MAG: lytic transglycosylase domain-containing protein [Ruminococcaceae bacterium]|nr:lytic transglycosylase domain-containing protein [Oscillospiraceae bacterium]
MIKRSRILIGIIALVIFAVAAIKIIPYIKKDLYPREYSEYVTLYSKEYNVPEHLIYAVIHSESGFDKDAVSSVGAMGLMQLMPDTFQWIAKRIDVDFENLDITDPETNIKCGTYYLNYLYQRFENWQTCLAAYNAGPNKVANWLLDSRYSDDGKSLKNIPITETYNYVNRVFSAEKEYIKLYYKGDD